MEKMIKRRLFIILLVLKSLLGGAQEYQHYSYETTEDNYGYYQTVRIRDTIFIREIIRDTIYMSGIEDLTTHLNISFDAFVKSFLDYTKQHDSLSEETYIKYYTGLINNELKKYRYVLNEYSLDFSKGSLQRDSIILKQMGPPSKKMNSMKMDFMFVLEGEKSTSDFLNSPKQQVRVVHKIFSDINELEERDNHKVGINFYFPDFDFNEKRAMAQFVRSVSLVADSIKVKEIRNLPLYFTFLDTGEHLEYLDGLSTMVDTVFLTKERKITDITPFISFEPLDEKKIKASLLQQIKNQVYLARLYMEDFPETCGKNILEKDIEKLMFSDYPDASWEYYMFSIIAILILLLIGICCYIFLPVFANFVNDNSMYVFAGGILLVLEIYLLFVFMIEGISKTVIFSFQNNNLMLFLPLMIMFIIPVMKKIVGRRENP